jgi:hypothetical protein
MVLRLIFLPLALIGLYLLSRVLLPGPLGVVVGLTLVAAGVLWAAATVQRGRRQHRK